MPSSANTGAVMTALKTIAAGIQLNGSNAFASGSIIVGRFKDLTDITPCMEISLATDQTARYLQGGKINDSQEYWMEVTVGQVDAAGTETLLASLRDVITQTFHTTARLQGLNGIEFSGLVEGSGTYGYTFRNGNWWRIYKIKEKARYEYSVIIVP